MSLRDNYRRLSDIGRDAPRLVAGEQVGGGRGARELGPFCELTEQGLQILFTRLLSFQSIARLRITADIRDWAATSVQP
jgi:hypothetical protein